MTEDQDIRDQWMGVKFLKHNFKPKLYEAADKSGKKVSIKACAEAAAD